MDDQVLFDEVLQLTLDRHRGESSDEELARLERLLGSNRQAIVYYLKIVNDSLNIRDFAEARTPAAQALLKQATLPFGAPSWNENSATSTQCTLRWLPARGLPLAAAILLVAAAGVVLWAARSQPLAHNAAAANDAAASARIVNVSGVEWAPGGKQFSTWSRIAPGDVLELRQGIINLFIDSGVELLIEGPAKVRFDSLERMVLVEGKIAARVGPDAIGFSIETPHANVIDRGTAFGVSVDGSRQTDVVVYEGIVDLDVLGRGMHPRRRLATGEALRVNNAGDLSRIASVRGQDFLSPLEVRPGGAVRSPVIASVADNIRLHDTAKYNRVVAGGFAEDCRAYVDRQHEWNGIDNKGLPAFLVGGDYIMTFNEDKTATELSLTVELARPAHLYLLIDNRVPPPAWLTHDFTDTGTDVGLDEVHSHVNVQAAAGAGRSLDQFYSVWRRDVLKPGKIVLGPLGNKKFSVPARVVRRGMYGIVATALTTQETLTAQEAPTSDSI